MHPQDFPNELRRLGELLTGPELSHGDMLMACEQLLQLFLAASGMEMSDPKTRQNIQLPFGKALAPSWAAFCIRDYRRTVAFMRGILQAIRTACQFFSEPVHVLYAGTGPFAALVLPLIPLLEDEEVGFTLLDIHPANITSLQKVATAFRVSSRIDGIVLADATSCQIKSPAHVLILEMMQPGLRCEPQMAAMLNLAPQLHPDGILIPQRISIKAGLLNPRRNQERMLGTLENSDVYCLLGPVMTLSQLTAKRHPASAEVSFPEIVIELPADREPGFRQLALFTQIEVFDNERLDAWECALTQPLVLTGLNAEMAPKKVGIRYCLSEDPGFLWRIID